VLLCGERKVHGGSSAAVAPYTAHLSVTRNRLLPDGSSWNPVSVDRKPSSLRGGWNTLTSLLVRNIINVFVATWMWERCSVKISWQGESSGLECRWSNLLDSNQSNSSITHEASSGVYTSFVPPLPDFAAHSLLGSGEWFVPWNLRWSVPRPSSHEPLG
jgi:hypothetical protein